MLKELDAYRRRLAASGSGFVLMGVTDRARQTLERTGLLDLIGPDNVLTADPHLVGSIERGMDRGRALLADLRVRHGDRAG